MQLNPPAATARPIFAIQRGSMAPSSTRALLGFVLALAGLVLGSLPSLLSYYLLRSNMSIVEYSEMVSALATAAVLLSGVGLFLLLRQLATSLSTPPAYMALTPLVVLISALFLVGVGLFFLWVTPILYGGFSTPPFSEDVFLAIQAVEWIARFAIGASVLLSVFGVVRALGVRRVPAVIPPPP